MYVPCFPHWEVVLRIVKYLKTHRGRGLFYRASGLLHVEVFTDSDWAGKLCDKRSATGYYVFLG